MTSWNTQEGQRQLQPVVASRGRGHWSPRGTEWGHLSGRWKQSVQRWWGLLDHTHSLKSTDAHTQRVDFTKCKLQLKPD